jgi:hypothetical protein
MAAVALGVAIIPYVFTRAMHALDSKTWPNRD